MCHPLNRADGCPPTFTKCIYSMAARALNQSLPTPSIHCTHTHTHLFIYMYSTLYSRVRFIMYVNLNAYTDIRLAADRGVLHVQLALNEERS